MSANDRPPSGYEQTVGEMKRLRSTRLDQRLGETGRRARTSRIIEDPSGADPTLAPDGTETRKGGFRVKHDPEERELSEQGRTELNFKDGLTLDDIPRIVAAENSRYREPNASKFARVPALLNDRQPKRQSVGANRELGGQTKLVERTKRYFSELSGLEYFIVRHIAVLQMQPLLEGHFNLDNLLGLIETRKQTFWNKFFNKNVEKGKQSKKKGVFGVPLETLVERDGVESTNGIGPGALRVPSLLDDAIVAMRQMDMSVEGIFRKNGNIRGLKDLAEKIDSKEVEVDLSKETAVQVAALLKKFLREMPDPLLTHKLHDIWTASQKIADLTKRRRLLHLTCCLLPKTHRDSLEVLFAFLKWTATFCQVDEDTGSKMDTHNLATVITPNILSADSKGLGMDESFLAIEAVAMLLDYNEEMCEVPEDIQTMLTDSELFNNMPEVTTKEILKRYGEMPKARFPATFRVEGADAPAQRTAESGDMYRGGTLVAPRIELDPQQTQAWQQESSVRHVQGNGISYAHHTAPTPPQYQGEFGERGMPFRSHQRAGSSESARSVGARERQAAGPTNFGKHPMGVGDGVI